MKNENPKSQNEEDPEHPDRHRVFGAQYPLWVPKSPVFTGDSGSMLVTASVTAPAGTLSSSRTGRLVSIDTAGARWSAICGRARRDRRPSQATILRAGDQKQEANRRRPCRSAGLRGRSPPGARARCPPGARRALSHGLPVQECHQVRTYRGPPSSWPRGDPGGAFYAVQILK